MGAEEPREALSLEHQVEVAHFISDGVLRATVLARGPEFLRSLGLVEQPPIAAPREATRTEAQIAAGLRSKVGNFLNPRIKFNAFNQLLIMKEFWNKLGMEMPELPEAAQLKMVEAVRANPSHRIIPTPLLSLEDRKAMAERARTWLGHPLGDGDAEEALWTAEVTAKETDQAVEAPDGTVWVFPVMDVRVQGERDAKQAGESPFAVQLLHQLKNHGVRDPASAL